MKQVYRRIYFHMFVKVFYVEMWKKIPTQVETELYNQIMEKFPTDRNQIHAQICDRIYVQLKLNI